MFELALHLMIPFRSVARHWRSGVILIIATNDDTARHASNNLALDTTFPVGLRSRGLGSRDQRADHKTE